MLLYHAPVQEGGIDYEWVTVFAASLLLVKAASLSTEKAPLPDSQPTDLLQLVINER